MTSEVKSNIEFRAARCYTRGRGICAEIQIRKGRGRFDRSRHDCGLVMVAALLAAIYLICGLYGLIPVLDFGGGQ